MPLNGLGWAGVGSPAFRVSGGYAWASRIEWMRHYLIGRGRGGGDFNAKARGRKERRDYEGMGIMRRSSLCPLCLRGESSGVFTTKAQRAQRGQEEWGLRGAEGAALRCRITTLACQYPANEASSRERPQRRRGILPRSWDLPLTRRTRQDAASTFSATPIDHFMAESPPPGGLGFSKYPPAFLRVLRDSVVNWHGGCSQYHHQPARKELERR